MTTGRMVAERWLANQLTQTGVPISYHPAPRGTAYPHVTVHLFQGKDIREMSDPVCKELLQYGIEAWDENTSSARVNNVAAKIVQAIDGKHGINVSWTDEYGTHEGTIVSCTRHGVIPVTQTVEEGKTYQRDGGLYHIHVLT